MKTPEEIKKALECCGMMDDDGCCKCPYNDGACDFQLDHDAFEYIQQLEDRIHCLINMMPEWISVKERLPENGGIYLCCLNSEFRTICYFDGGQWDDTENAYVTHLVTHWMPLPNLPNEDWNV